MTNLFRLTGLAVVATAFTGCLQTRESSKEVEEKQVIRKQMSTLQQSNADTTSRFQDLEDQVRSLNGRFETIENHLKIVATKADSADTALDGKMKASDQIYKEELTKLNGEITTLKAQLASLQEDQRRSAEIRAESEAKAKASAETAKKDLFGVAEDHFEKKAWKEAILDYEKYRSANPKGKQFATATYKIGFAFQELGMSDEAGAFYEEVIAKFPKSKEAGKASTRLKALKKK